MRGLESTDDRLLRMRRRVEERPGTSAKLHVETPGACAPFVLWPQEKTEATQATCAWQAYVPACVAELAHLRTAVPFVPDVAPEKGNMADEMEVLRRQMDHLFGWREARYTAPQAILRGSAQAMMLLRDRHCEEENNDLLQTT